MQLGTAPRAAWAAWIAVALAGCAALVGRPEPIPDARRVTLISMNDLHSHAEAFPPIAAFAAAYRAAHPSEIVIQTDSGDWFSGTVYSALGPHPESAVAPELEFFARQGIVSTLGNHEFDATPDGLWNLLAKARTAGYRDLVVSNLEVAAGSRFAGLVGETPERGSASATVLHRRLLREYRSPDGTRRLAVGFVGILGPNAIEGSWSSRAGTGLRFVGWNDATRTVDWSALERAVGAQVRALRAEGAELVIALLHGGRPEDERIAKARLGIDVVAAGHTHAEYPPTRIGRTWVYQSGGEGHSFGRYTFLFEGEAGGRAELRYVGGGAVVVEELRLDPGRLDADVLRAEEARLAAHREEVRARFLARGIDLDEVLLAVEGPESSEGSLARLATEWGNAHGRFVASAVLYELCRLLADFSAEALAKRGDFDDPAGPGPAPVQERGVDLFLIALELIRSHFDPDPGKGGVTYEEVFEMVSVGMQAPETPGARLVILEVSRADLQNLVASLWLYSRLVAEATPAFSESLVLKTGFRNPLRPVAGLAPARIASGLPPEGSAAPPEQVVRPLPAQVRLATTAFMAENLERMPRWLYAPRRVASLDVTMEELLAAYLRRLDQARQAAARSGAARAGAAPD